MRRGLAGSALVALPAAIPVLIVALVRPGLLALAVEVYLLFLAGVALVAVARAAQSAFPARPSELERARRRRPAPAERLPDLARIERLSSLALSSGFDLHYRLRPILREIAAHRLAARGGLDLDGDAPAARAALGDGLWELLHAERPRPSARFGEGLDRAQLREIVETLERL